MIRGTNIDFAVAEMIMFEGVTIALSLIVNPFLHSSHTCSEIRKSVSIVGITASDDHLGRHKPPHHEAVGLIACPLWRHTWGLNITKLLVLFTKYSNFSVCFRIFIWGRRIHLVAFTLRPIGEDLTDS